MTPRIATVWVKPTIMFSFSIITVWNLEMMQTIMIVFFSKVIEIPQEQYTDHLHIHLHRKMEFKEFKNQDRMK